MHKADRPEVIQAEHARRGDTTTVSIRGEAFEATWVKLKDILKVPDSDCPGLHELAAPTFVVDGPSAGKWWADDDSIVGVRHVRQLADRTCMEVEFTDGDTCWGTFSGMRFLRVEGPVPV